MRRKIIAGNWKMNKTGAEAIELAKALKVKSVNIERADMVICPPFTALYQTAEIIKASKIKLGAQNVYWEDSGAFTGEISLPMLKDAGCEYAIIGHSERRQFFGETDETVNRKIQKVTGSDLTAIVCVGETLEQRKAGDTERIINTQISNGFAGITQEQMKRIIIAYEPIWAIGTGMTATPEQAEDVHLFIRNLIKSLYGAAAADMIRIQYGGSVKPDNAAELLSQPDIDGALVGGASLKADAFIEIIKAA
ncbi:triose-phosphate isomerase [candidate division KSB1 bacterium]|nr:triose-phosphate isomerase [candidate division KSB1 bacterium]